MSYTPTDHSAKNREAAEINKKYGFPELEGSEKQIAWAESIRLNAFNELNNSADRNLRRVIQKKIPMTINGRGGNQAAVISKIIQETVTEYKLKYINDLKTNPKMKKASYWIDNRNNNYRSIFDNDISAEITQKLLNYDKYTKMSFSVGDICSALENKNVKIQITERYVQKLGPRTDNVVRIKYLSNGGDTNLRTDMEYRENLQELYGEEFFKIYTGMGTYTFVAGDDVQIPKRESLIVKKKTKQPQKTAPKKRTTQTKSTPGKSKTTTRTPKHGMTAKQIIEAIKGMSKSDKEAFLDKLNRTLPENKQEHTYKAGIRRGAYIADAKRVSKSFGWRLTKDGKKVYYEGRSSRADSDPERTWHGTAAAKTHLKKIVGETATKTKTKKKTTAKKTTAKKTTKKTTSKRK